MLTKTEIFNKTQLKEGLFDIYPGDTVRVYQKLQEKGSAKKKGRKIQMFEGLVIAKKHGNGISATITVRKIISGVGVEKIFPIHSPIIEKIEILKRAKVRRAKLYYLRTAKGKKARLKTKDSKNMVWEKKESTADLKTDSANDSEKSKKEK